MSKILIGRGVTNSNGVATMTENANGEPINGYTATGAGKVDFSAGCTIDERTFLSETYELWDYMMYDETEYSSVGTGSAKSDVTNETTFDNTRDWRFSAEIKVTGNACRVDITPPTYQRTMHIGIGKNGTGRLCTYVGRTPSGESSVEVIRTFNNDEYYPVKIEKQGTTIRWYFNDELIRTDTEFATQWIGNFNTERILLTTWQSNTIYIKNMKVEEI